MIQQPTINFSDLQTLHSRWSMMDKIGKMRFLCEKKGEIQRALELLSWNRLGKGYYTSDEQNAIQMLQEIYNSLQIEHNKVNQEFSQEWFKEFTKFIQSLR